MANRVIGIGANQAEQAAKASMAERGFGGSAFFKEYVRLTDMINITIVVTVTVICTTTFFIIVVIITHLHEQKVARRKLQLRGCFFNYHDSMVL